MICFLNDYKLATACILIKIFLIDLLILQLSGFSMIEELESRISDVKEVEELFKAREVGDAQVARLYPILIHI